MFHWYRTVGGGGGGEHGYGEAMVSRGNWQAAVFVYMCVCVWGGPASHTTLIS